MECLAPTISGAICRGIASLSHTGGMHRSELVEFSDLPNSLLVSLFPLEGLGAFSLHHLMLGDDLLYPETSCKISDPYH